MSCPGDTMFNVSCQGHQTLGLNKFPTLGFISPGGHHTRDLKNILDKMWLHEHFQIFLVSNSDEVRPSRHIHQLLLAELPRSS